MNYSSDIQNSIEFIESNVKENLTPEIVAEHVGYSVYHFCRVFQICMGTTVMEYIRKRRLSLAAVALFQGNKIINIAADYGYETQSGFTKAFRKEYGYNPTQYIARMTSIRSYLSDNKTMSAHGGYDMNPIIIKKPSFNVAGYGINTNIEDGSYTKDIAAFWNKFDTNGWEEKMYAQLNPPKHGEVGICIPESKDSGNLIYLLGVVVDHFEKVTSDMISLEVPEATYAIFTTPPVDGTHQGGDGDSYHEVFPMAIKQTWKYIFEEWFKNSNYEYDEAKLDFEFYDERCHFRPDTVMDIYVPIIEKSK